MPQALTTAEFAALMAPLGPFEPRPRIAVACSGGADSLALALLAAEWAQGQGGEILALIVDHSLRADSRDEAERVAGWLAGRGIPHRILTWRGTKPSADIQAEARAARHGLIEECCRADGLLHVLLGHHREDQAETLLLRLGRGSGLDGLAGMAAIADGVHVRWLRPFLQTPKARLPATLRARGQDWVDDPSNRNPLYTRVRLRHMAPALAAEGLNSERLAATARRLGRARAALGQAVAEAAARWVRPEPAGWAMVAAGAFGRTSEEIGLRLLTRLLMAIGGGAYPPRLERTEALFTGLRGGLAGARTLAGCRVTPMVGGEFLFSREAARMAPPVALSPGAEIVWDGRFRAEVAADAAPGLTLGALGPHGWRRIANLAGGGLPPVPAAVRPTLPAVYGADGISAVPHLGYNRSNEAGRCLRWIVAAPSNPLTVAGHCLV
jgi:tRNA(Ile)-lysidine synthase